MTLEEWMKSASSIRGELVLWPTSYSARLEHDVVEILGGSEQVIARVGETVQLSGGKISVDWNSENYRQLHQELSGD